MHRLIALDVDGTMLNSKSELSDTVRDAILRTVDQGVQIVIVSGRNLQGTLHIIGLLGIDCWFICSGGAIISNASQTTTLGRIALKVEQAREILLHARHVGAGIFLETVSGLFWEGPKKYLDLLVSVHGIRIEKVEDILAALCFEPLKIVMVMENEKLLAIEKELHSRNLGVYLAFSMPHYLEVTQAGVNKGKALHKLVHHLGVPLSQVVAIGDGENDLSMFEVTGYRIAMGNAPLKVRQAADWIAPTNDEDGLAAALHVLQEAVQ